METRIYQIAPDALPPGGPALGVVPRGAGADGAARYRELPAEVLPAGRPLVALVRTPVLTSSDTVAVAEAAWQGREVHVTVEMTTYTGTLFANVPYVGLVEADLGAPAPGPYTLVVTWRTRPFDDLARPDDTGAPTATTRRLDFQVR